MYSVNSRAKKSAYTVRKEKKINTRFLLELGREGNSGTLEAAVAPTSITGALFTT